MFKNKRVVNVRDLRSYAVTDNVERGRTYLYVYAGQGTVVPITAETPLIKRSARQWMNATFPGCDEQKEGFYATHENSYAPGGKSRRWEFASDSGVKGQTWANGNFMLDPLDLAAEGILVEDANGVVVALDGDLLV